MFFSSQENNQNEGDREDDTEMGICEDNYTFFYRNIIFITCNMKDKTSSEMYHIHQGS